MNIFCWILCGLIIVSILVYLFFTFIKQVKMVQDISSIVPIILAEIVNILFLLSFVPDSYHILKLSTLAFSFASIAQFLSTFITNKKGNIAMGLSFLLSLFFWIILYKSVFYIYRVPVWINIIAASSYFVIFLLLFLIFIKKQNSTFYVFAILSVILVSFLHYCAFVSLCFMPVNYNIIKFIGITILLGYVVFGILNNSIINIKIRGMINFISLLLSFVLIAVSNFMILN